MTEAVRHTGGRRTALAVVPEWIKRKDPGLLAVKRSVRAAITIPTVFGLTHLLFNNPQVSLFGAFGSFALLLLVDFPGRFRTRLISYVVLWLAGSGLISLGTALSTVKWAAVVVMAVVGFVVLFAGIVSPQAAAASTATLLLFVLPVAVVQPAAGIGPRLIGWSFAGAIGIVACMFLWPTRWHDELRRRLSATVSAIAGLAGAGADGGPDSEAQLSMQAELSQLRSRFASTPYPPTATAGSTVALAKLVGRVEWAAGNATILAGTVAWQMQHLRQMVECIAETLRRSAELICDNQAYPVEDPEHVRALQRSMRELEELMGNELSFEVSTLIDPGTDGDQVAIRGGGGLADAPGQGIASSLDPSFSARALGTAVLMLADTTVEASGVRTEIDSRRRWSLGSETESPQVWHRTLSHLSFRSVWFRNAVRGAAGLALAVAVVEITDVEHGFWVVLGTLSVLRSNALGTGATAVRAVGGTTVGFIVGAAITVGVGGHPSLLWVLLPFAVLVSGVAPSMISFAAGQAGFTLVVIILFNIIAPSGWRVGLTRIEDVAIGCGVSIVVGLLFWPRGAMAALGRALSDAFVMSSGYLADAVVRLTTPNGNADMDTGERASHAAYGRLDDTFRQFLTERGAKVVPVDVVANLFTGSNRIRLAAYTLSTLPIVPLEPGFSALESVEVAGAVLRDSYAASHRWYEEFGEVLSGQRGSMDQAPHQDETLHRALRTAFEEARVGRRDDQLRSMLQMLWADEILETQRQVQADLAGSVELFTRGRRFALTGK